MNRPTTRRRLLAGSLATTAVLVAAGQSSAAPAATPHPEGTPVADPSVPASTFFSTIFIEPAVSVISDSDGDLWPTTWADDDALYTLNGDGRGFSNEPFADIVMNRVTGTPETGLTGERLCHGDAIAPIWSDPTRFNRKPTGIIAVDGNDDGKDELYAAVQDLAQGDRPFDEAPAASISVSTDYGKTWSWTAQPMFPDHQFTTIFFLDFGQSNRGARVLGDDGDQFVYAYGIDNNWRDSFTNRVPDPVDLWLARVPIGQIQDRAAWQFFAGLDADTPIWDWDIANRVAVLHDDRRVYTDAFLTGVSDMTVISQGSVVYNAPLKRYLYTSWTEYTFEFYEAPQPWGPWTLFAHKDFGGYPWIGLDGGPGCEDPKNGGYATIIPSKFISDDGRSMWVQSNWFVGHACGLNTYRYNFRRMTVTPYVPEPPHNIPAPGRNMSLIPGGVPIERATHFGRYARLTDGKLDLGDDSWTGERKTEDFWGIAYPREFTFDCVLYSTGMAFPDGGWFASDLRVQVRRAAVWTDAPNQSVSPEYPYDASASGFRTFTFRFDPTIGDGVRIVGRPGGEACFTSISEFAILYTGGNPVELTLER